MNPVFYLLVILGAFVLWFLFSFAFYPLGKIICKLVKNVMNNMSKEEKETDES